MRRRERYQPLERHDRAEAHERSEEPIVIDRASPVPRYFQLAQWMELEFSHGRWPRGKMLPSERELARRSGLSVTTVRQALERFERRGWIHREQGLGSYAMAKREPPRPESPARPRVVLAFFDLAGEIDEGYRFIVSETIAGALNMLTPANCDLQVLDIRPGSRKETVAQLLSGELPCDGLIITDGFGKLRPLWEQAAASGRPHVALGEPPAPGDAAPKGGQAVFVETHKAGGLAANVLAHQRRTRCAYLGPNGRRLAGYRAHLSDYDTPLAGERTILDHAIDAHACERAGYEGMLKLLAQDPRPDGLFAANDYRALGALRALADEGVDVPGEIDVIGCDDVAAAANARPGLTTMVLPHRTAADRAAWRLLLWLTDGQKHQPVVDALDPELVYRGSTRADPQA